MFFSAYIDTITVIENSKSIHQLKKLSLGLRTWRHYCITVGNLMKVTVDGVETKTDLVFNGPKFMVVR